MARTLNTRAAAAKLSWQIVDQGKSLDSVLADYVGQHAPSPQDKGFIQELVYGVCRWYGELDELSKGFLRSPIRKKDRIVHFILLVGIYQLRHLETADHAAVAETVQACKQLNKVWAKKLVNGCLRNYQRNPPEIADRTSLSHPRWLEQELASAWPNHALAILDANNHRPPMCLRVNSMQYSRDEYLALLDEASIPAKADPFSSDGIILEQALSVNKLPNFERGACSVQDTAAQLAAHILGVNAGHQVLDACAAPGGKTAHMLERMKNQGLMHALDISESRCEQMHSTLSRLNLQADIFTADGSKEPNWPTPEGGYDRILIDAPCSGLGVIRRHPDIKHHRRPSDIDALNRVQAALLRNLWQLLKSGGKLLYMTCSVLPRENEHQLKRFLEQTNDAILLDLIHPSALKLEVGAQTLPGVHQMDGFYYGLLQKR